MRLAATLACDLVVQFRNGFHLAVAVVLVAAALLLQWAPELDWAPLVPAVVAGNLAMVGFYFLAGSVLLEKAEGTPRALAVSPLHPAEYAASKVATLAGLSLVENLVLVAMLLGTGFALLPMAAGILLASALFTVLGLRVVARHTSVNGFILPSIPWLTMLCAPILPQLGLLESPLWLLHPMTGPLVLMQAALQPVSPCWIAYGLIYPSLWVAAGLWRGSP